MMMLPRYADIADISMLRFSPPPLPCWRRHMPLLDADAISAAYARACRDGFF